MADPRRRQRIAWRLLLAGAIGLACWGLARYQLPTFLKAYINRRATQIVKERFRAEVQFGSFDVAALYPQLIIQGGNVALSRRNQAGASTLIFVKRFSFDTDLWGFLYTPAHVRHLQLQGMVIHIPPRRPDEPRQTRKTRQHFPVIIDYLGCDHCQVNILPRTSGKEPLHFEIHHLAMEKVGLGRSAPYRAELTNAVPRGEIQSEGSFGPWQPEEPSLTPLSGSYLFSHADLEPLRGISGTLDSRGRFQGVLERIVADGETSTPNFALDITGHPLALHTQFHALIDGTTGDTALDPVTAQFLHSSLLAHGGIFGMPGQRGKAVLLDVTVNPGRLEDLLRLGVKSPRPTMTGNVYFHTQLAIPPGEERISRRLRLDGSFLATSAQLTSPTLQEKLKKLSRRAQGKPKQQNEGSDVFGLKGRFILAEGIARFPHLTFSIPGATLDLQGNYSVASEWLDFYGQILLQAKLSQTSTGIKSLLLRAVDPFFKGPHGGTVLSVKITGTRRKPVFRLSRHHEGKRISRERASLPRD